MKRFRLTRLPIGALSGLAALACCDPGVEAQEIETLDIKDGQLRVRWHMPEPILEMAERLDGPWKPALPAGEGEKEMDEALLPLEFRHGFFRLRSVFSAIRPPAAELAERFGEGGPEFLEVSLRVPEGGGATVLAVRVAPPKNGEWPESITMVIDDDSVEIFDRFGPKLEAGDIGDGIFAGPVEIKPEVFQEFGEALERLESLGEGVPIFNGREFSGRADVGDFLSVDPETGDSVITVVPQVEEKAPDGDAGGAGIPGKDAKKGAKGVVAVPIGGVAQPGGAIFGAPGTVDPERTLIIRHPRVVEDPTRTFEPCTGVGNPNGVWTFGYLVEQMANTSLTGIPAPEFARRWIRHWEFDQVINFDHVPNRLTAVKNLIIDPWEAASGGPDVPLDLTKAPFRLCAIVNRVDLRDVPNYGGRGNAGELRFVYCAVGPDGRPIDIGGDRPYGQGDCPPIPFLVIFEYGVPKSSCHEVRQWAAQWLNLQNFVLGSPAYNAALEAITEQVVVSNAAPAKPNGSALNQLRSNEILENPWDMREWRLFDEDSDAHHLREVTTKQTPQMIWQGDPVLSAFINTNEPAILTESHLVPLTFAGSPFLSGHAPIPDPTFFWNAPGIANNDARHKFSLNTCNACHGGETGTDFTHISERAAGVPSTLSGFLTGITIADPVSGVPRSFNDLARRAADLDAAANLPCFFLHLTPRAKFVH